MPRRAMTSCWCRHYTV